MSNNLQEPNPILQREIDYISNWVTPDFLFPKKEGWAHWGCLGWFGEYALNHLDGSILEIGIGESSLYFTALAKKFNRKIYHCDISEGLILKYLSVKGYFSDDYCMIDSKLNNYIEKQCIIFAGSSNDFFNKIKLYPLALAFIDGDHIYEQVKKDFDNTIQYIIDDGFVLLHDTYPPDERHAGIGMCSTSYKLRQELERDNRFDCLTLTRGTAFGLGLTIIRRKPENRMYFNE